ncbi:MAG: GNAT family N-acetyltransferase [bacterium]
MISWICFEWELASVELILPSVPPLVLRPAQTDEENTVLKVLLDAFAMDTAWGDISRRIEEGMGRYAGRAFEHPEPSCIVALHGQRVVGASLLDADPDAGNHLLSGPMILHEYRNRGVGSGLLAASLVFLRDKGLSKVRGVTRANSTVSRFVYPKFSSLQTPYNQDPLLPAGR